MSTIGTATESPVDDRAAARGISDQEAGPRTPRRGTLADPVYLDWLERGFVLVLYGWLVWKILNNYSVQGGLANLLLLPSEGLVVLFLLLRRRTANISRSLSEWIIAIAATCAPLMVTPGVGHALIAPQVAVTALLMGMLLQLHAKLTLGRSFGCVPANRGLKLSGPYRFVRHPMYAGYWLSHTAFLAVNLTPWNLLVYSVSYSAQVSRLLAEERLLAREPEYREYQKQVPYRLIPWVF